MSVTRLTHDHIQVWVTIDGKESPIYGIQQDEVKRELTCWIASQLGKEFVVWVKKCGKTTDDYHAVVFLDGKRATGRSLRKNQITEKSLKHTRVSSTEVRSFVFGALKLTEVEAVESTDLHKLGEIEVRIQMGTEKIESCIGKPFVLNGLSLEPGMVNERSKKAAVHQIQLGQARYSEKRESISFTQRKGTSNTIFRFRYRPLDVLQANGIAPPPLLSKNPVAHEPVATTSTTKQELGKRKRTGTRDQDEREDNEGLAVIERVEKKLLEELEVVRKLKRAKEGRKDTKQSVKREPVKQEPKVVFIPGDIIDLT